MTDKELWKHCENIRLKIATGDVVLKNRQDEKGAITFIQKYTPLFIRDGIDYDDGTIGLDDVVEFLNKIIYPTYFIKEMKCDDKSIKAEKMSVFGVEKYFKINGNYIPIYLKIAVDDNVTIISLHEKM